MPVAVKLAGFWRGILAYVKRFQMVEFKGSTQEKWPSEIFRFGYRKAANDKMAPDPAGSANFCNTKRIR